MRCWTHFAHAQLDCRVGGRDVRMYAGKLRVTLLFAVLERTGCRLAQANLQSNGSITEDAKREEGRRVWLVETARCPSIHLLATPPELFSLLARLPGLQTTLRERHLPVHSQPLHPRDLRTVQWLLHGLRRRTKRTLSLVRTHLPSVRRRDDVRWRDPPFPGSVRVVTR